MKTRFWYRKIAGLILIGIAVVAVLGFVVMTLWNNVLAQVVDVRTITFGQALGIFVLSKILFGGFKGRSGGGWRGRSAWGKQMKEKWQAMSPEEQQQFKQNWRNRCGGWASRKGADEQSDRSAGDS